jgi:hypothetical protein
MDNLPNLRSVLQGVPAIRLPGRPRKGNTGISKNAMEEMMKRIMPIVFVILMLSI